MKVVLSDRLRRCTPPAIRLWMAQDEPLGELGETRMGMQISLTNNLTANGVRWHVIEGGKILKAATASTELQARAAAIKALKETEI